MAHRQFRAVKEYGQFWEKVSQRVGRMAGDCQDRYRNNLQHTSDRKIGNLSHVPFSILLTSDVTGLWTKKEEDQLITIMKELESKSAATKSDILWEEVSKRMGGTRTNLQLRQKWCVANLDSQGILNEGIGTSSRNTSKWTDKFDGLQLILTS